MRFETIKDGTTVELREPTMGDLDESFRFFNKLPREDRRYFRVDVTNRDIVERRIRQGERGEVFRVVAVADQNIVADGALEFSGASWNQHLAEIRVIVDRDYRNMRLGALLIQELFRVAEQREVERVLVNVAAPQTAVRKTCERLGFHVDAVLPGHVKDSDGNLHAMIVMSCTLDEVWRELKDFYREDNWPDG